MIKLCVTQVTQDTRKSVFLKQEGLWVFNKNQFVVLLCFQDNLNVQ